MTPKFLGTIKDGKLTLDNKHKFELFLRCLDGRVELTVKKFRKKRSDPQNRYYWGVVIKILGEHFGYESEEMHEALKWQFLRKKGPVPTVISTTKLNTMEFMEYLDRIMRWASIEHKIYIPSPDEVEFYS